MKRILLIQGIIYVLALPTMAFGAATVTTLAKNGPDDDKYVLAIVGDGFTADDMEEYRDKVDDIIMSDLFDGDDMVWKNRSAFNIYRIDVESNESGISEWTYRLKSPDSDPDLSSSWELDPDATQIDHDTALSYVATGVWAHCWHKHVESEADTEARLQAIYDEVGINPNGTIVMVNTNRTVGCSGSSSFVANDASNYSVYAHEIGHMAPGLKDEYDLEDEHYTGTWNTKNCSTELDEDTVVWSDLLDVDIPTTWDSSTMDADETVGMFEGCMYHDTGIYRPVYNCRMRYNSNQFCPVCRQHWETFGRDKRDNASDYSELANYPGALCKGVSTALTVSTVSTAGNDDTAAHWAVCPVRRIKDGSVYTNRFFGQAWVKDRSETEDVCCRVRTRNPGGATKDGKEVCTSGSSSSYMQLVVDFPKVYDNYTWSHVEMLCKLPAKYNDTRSEMLTYRVGQEYF